MRIDKNTLTKAIDKVKSVAVKNPAFPALEGVLVKDGYLTASNMDLTVQTKLEGSDGEEFIIPMRALELIKNLPDGEVYLEFDDKKDTITIQTDNIKNSYQTYKPQDFAFYKNDAADEKVDMPGEDLMNVLSHVVFAAADKDARQAMTGIYFCGTAGMLNVVALDGHVLAWDKLEVDGAADMKIIVPKNAVRKLLSMEPSKNITISHNRNSAIFRTDDCTIYTRLIEGDYFRYEAMFANGTTETQIEKKRLVEALVRAKTCMEESRPIIFEIEGRKLNISVVSSTGNYKETVDLQTDAAGELRIGFSLKLVLDAVKAFTCCNICMTFTNAAAPMILSADDSEMRVVVLPVRLQPSGISKVRIYHT